MFGKIYILEFLLISVFLITAIPAFSTEALLNDNFDTDNVNLKWKRNQQYGWEIKDGCLFNMGKGGSITLNLEEKGSWIFSCTVKEVQVRFQYPGIYISFIERGDDEYYTLHVKPSQQHEAAFYYIWKINSSSREVVGTSFFSKLGLNFNFNEVHKVSVSFGRDQVLRFYWDDKLVLEKSNIFFRPDTIKIAGSVVSDLYVDNVEVKQETSSPQKGNLLFENDFSDIDTLLLSGHENYKEKKTIDGNEVAAGINEKRVRLKYNFRTKGHDAFMLSKDINVKKANYLSVRIKGDGSKHKIFLVLTDASGENHYLLSSSLKYTDWSDFNICLAEYLKEPFPGEVTGNSWGGDGNQKIDFPITRITIGINDIPDSFIGHGEIEIGKFGFWE